MKLNDIIKEYHRKLLHIYPPQEIQSIVGLVLETYLKISRAEITLRKYDEIHEALQAALLDILIDLETGRPVQYIIGETTFYGQHIMVTNDVLIPRQETEELVHWIVNDNRRNSVMKHFLDIGTGSGCIAIALAHEIKYATVSACDVSAKALDVATKNAQHTSKDIRFFKMNILKPPLLPDFFDVIVSNPPYVTQSEKKVMHRNIVEHEPQSALFVPDKDPLLYYRAIAGFAQKHLNANGTLYLEINERFGKEVAQLLKKTSFLNIELRKDINGKDRMIKAVYQNGPK